MIRFVLIIIITLLIPFKSLAQSILKDNDEKSIIGVLKAQQNAWNEGNIEEFMKGYIKSKNLVFNSSTGTITAGNSCAIADGAAFIHVSDTKYSHSQAELLDYESIALEPKLMGLGPVSSINNLLKRNHLNINDISVYEINEAFAAQILACQSHLNIPKQKLNMNGGAISLGHPIGATGSRLLVTLIHLIKNKPGQLGIASLCVSGGQGVAVLIRSL